jgi:hypothetical protein
MVASMGAWEDGYAAGYRAAWMHAYAEPVIRDAIVSGPAGPSRARSAPKRRRAPSAYNKRLGAAIKRLNKRAKKKDGDYRKGWSRSKVFKMAHKEAKR